MAKKELVSVKELAARIAKAKGVPEDKASKQLRTRIRGNFDLLATTSVWPLLVKQGKVNRDGDRYQPMPAKTADALFKAITKGTPLKDALKASRARAPKPAPADTPAPTGDAS